MIKGTFSLTSDIRNQIAFLIIKGPINAASSPELRKSLRDHFEAGVQGIILDMTHIDYMDSSALATLVEGTQVAEEHKSKLILAGPIDEKIEHLFEITRLEGLFERASTVDEATTMLTKVV